jgi:hypothetical protein
MMKPDMQNAHWKPCSSTTACCTGCSVPSAAARPSIVVTLLAAHRVRQHRAAIVRHVVDQHRARSALGAVAAQLGSRQPQLVAQRPGQRLLLHHFHAPRLPFTFSVISRSPPKLRPRPAQDLVAGRAHYGASGNHAQNEIRSINPARPAQIVGVHQKAGAAQVEPP